MIGSDASSTSDAASDPMERLLGRRPAEQVVAIHAAPDDDDLSRFIEDLADYPGRRRTHPTSPRAGRRRGR